MFKSNLFRSFIQMSSHLTPSAGTVEFSDVPTEDPRDCHLSLTKVISMV